MPFPPHHQKKQQKNIELVGYPMFVAHNHVNIC